MITDPRIRCTFFAPKMTSKVVVRLHLSHGAIVVIVIVVVVDQ